MYDPGEDRLYLFTIEAGRLAPWTWEGSRWQRRAPWFEQEREIHHVSACFAPAQGQILVAMGRDQDIQWGPMHGDLASFERPGDEPDCPKLATVVTDPTTPTSMPTSPPRSRGPTRSPRCGRSSSRAVWTSRSGGASPATPTMA